VVGMVSNEDRSSCWSVATSPDQPHAVQAMNGTLSHPVDCVVQLRRDLSCARVRIDALKAGMRREREFAP
jgi:hypothetical protein